jgi:ribose transport system substrate-binding protein
MLRIRPVAVLAGLVASAALLVVAFAGAGAYASSRTASKVVPAGISSAEAIVEQHEVKQPPIPVPKLKRRPPSGKRITITTCTIPVCRQATDAAVTAAEKLGWKATYEVWDPTPQGYVESWNEILAKPPQLIAFTGGFPDVLVAHQIAKAASLKIPMIDIAPALGKVSSPGVDGVVGGSAMFQRDGVLMADTVVANAKGKAATAFIDDSELGVEFAPTLSGYKAELARTCGCSTSVFAVATAGPAGPRIGTIVSYVQSHPNVRYLVAAVSSMLVGVPQALKSVGLNKRVKLVTRAPQASDITELHSGGILAEVQDEDQASGWRAIDSLARITVGETPSMNVAGYHAILTAKNTTSGVVPTPPGIPNAYLSAWHVK